MSKKDKVIVKQLQKIERLKEESKKNKEVISRIKGHFISIGQPCNDNSLGFNKEQLGWCYRVLELIESLE